MNRYMTATRSRHRGRSAAAVEAWSGTAGRQLHVGGGGTTGSQPAVLWIIFHHRQNHPQMLQELDSELTEDSAAAQAARQLEAEAETLGVKLTAEVC